MSDAKKTMKSIVSYALLPPTEKGQMNGGSRMELFRQVIMADLPLQAVDYLVYGYLFRHSNFTRLLFYDGAGKATKQGHGYYVGVTLDVILRALPIRRKNLIDSIKRLEEAGIISIPFKASKQDRKGSCYRIVTDNNTEHKWINTDTPRLKGTKKQRGQGVKDRWEWFNGLFGVMGQSGIINELHLPTTAVGFMLVLYALSEWKQIDFGDDGTVPGWYATVDINEVAERFQVTRRTIERTVEKLTENNILTPIKGDIYMGRGEVGMMTYRLLID